MSRLPRIVIPGLPLHVILRGNNRRRLFSSHADYQRFVLCLAAGLDTSACKLHQLTLMTNHVHLIAVPPQHAALSTLVHRTCQRYAQARNAQREATGKLFEERFHSKPILDDEYLATATVYNDVNAFRAGVVRAPLAHPWSTGPLHAGRAAVSRIPASMWTPSPWYLALGATPESRAQRYRELVDARLALGETEPPLDYSRRVERPDRSSAREAPLGWGRASR